MDTKDTNFINESLKHLGLETDRELEVIAGLAKNTLSKSRQGAQPLSAFASAKIWDLRGYKWATESLSKIFGEKGRKWIDSEDRRRRLRSADSQAR